MPTSREHTGSVAAPVSGEPPDYDAVARDAFGNADAGIKIQQAVHELLRYKTDTERLLPPERRRVLAHSIGKTAARLDQKIRRLDATDMAALFRFPLEPGTDGSQGPLRIHGLQDAWRLLELLHRLQDGAVQLAETMPAPAVGQPERPDPLAFGVEWMASIWRVHTPRSPDRSLNIGGFGDLARRVLTAPPLGYGANSVRHAVDRYLRSPGTGTG